MKPWFDTLHHTLYKESIAVNTNLYLFQTLRLSLHHALFSGYSSALAARTSVAVPASTDPVVDLTTPLKLSAYVAPLVKTNGTQSSKYRSAAARYKKGYGKNKIVGLDNQEEYAAQITFGSEKHYVILDTGSSDTWLAGKNLVCIGEFGETLPQADCAFGSLYGGGYPGGLIKNDNFIIEYGDGEYLSGTLGYAPIQIAGFHIKHQEVAIVNSAYWEGDNVTSGLMGLAYSALTDSTLGTKNGAEKVYYSPVVQTMISQGLQPGLFSLALQRANAVLNQAPGGFIAFGGLPPVNFTPNFASTPIEIYQFDGYPEVTATNRSFYTIKPEAYIYGSSPSASSSTTKFTNPYNSIVDSGTTHFYVPTPVYDGYTKSLGAAALNLEGNLVYPCNATGPYLGVQIGGSVFNVSSKDIVFPGAVYTDKKSGVEYCQLGLADAGAGKYAFPIMGDVFLRNVVAVFNVGASVMQFAQHNY